MTKTEVEQTTRISPVAGIDAILAEKIAKTRKQQEWQVFIIQTFCVLLVVFLLFGIVFRFAVIHGDSMQPSYYAGDLSLLWRLGGGYRTGDVIFFENAAMPDYLIKRVIAGPGQVVEIDEETGKVIVDGAFLYEPYAFADTRTRDGGVAFPLTLGEDEYFVLGDNRTNSLDSRSTDIGLVSEDDIIGKVIFLFRVVGK